MDLLHARFPDRGGFCPAIRRHPNAYSVFWGNIRNRGGRGRSLYPGLPPSEKHASALAIGLCASDTAKDYFLRLGQVASARSGFFWTVMDSIGSGLPNRFPDAATKWQVSMAGGNSRQSASAVARACSRRHKGARLDGRIESSPANSGPSASSRDLRSRCRVILVGARRPIRYRMRK
jgi:hypothetical protein